MEYASMKICRNILLSIIVIPILYACSAVSMNTTTLSPTLAPSLSPTNTITPTVTIIPTQTTSPTLTAVPIPEYYEGVDAPSLEAYTTVTPEQLDIITDDMEEHWILTDTEEKYYSSEPGGVPAFIGMIIHCTYGTTSIGRGSVKLVNPNGGHDEWIQLWEFLGPDKQHRIARFYIGGPRDDQYTRGLAQQRHNTIRGLETGKPINIFTVSTIAGFIPKEEIDPLVWSMTNGASDKDKEAHKEFHDTRIIPEWYKRMIVWVSDVSMRK
jgi:hypothetical protein